MAEPTLEPPSGARVKLISGELGTILSHTPGHEGRSADVELDSGFPARITLPVSEYVDPSPCSEPGCKKWAVAEATKTAWALDYPRRAADRAALGHMLFCADHVPTVGNTWWTAIRPIGEDLPLPRLA